MAALRRRTQFAAPLILSVAASCSGSKEPGSEKQAAPLAKRFPGTTWSVTMPSPPGCVAAMDVDCPADVPCKPPMPQAVECPPGSSGSTVIRIGQLASKDCAIVPRACVDESCAKLRTPCPLPAGQPLVQPIVYVWHIEKRGADCHAEEEDTECPPGKDCNPPMPRKVECPPGVTEDKMVDITQLADGSCAVVPEGCKDARCVTAKTACPPQ
ncbi:MAG: hypothetical protein JWP01_1236 [Myxococcales bacterium]|nr:hypothetical protein [Myxococcales bacterium]